MVTAGTYQNIGKLTNREQQPERFKFSFDSKGSKAFFKKLKRERLFCNSTNSVWSPWLWLWVKSSLKWFTLCRRFCRIFLNVVLLVEPFPVERLNSMNFII